MTSVACWEVHVITGAETWHAGEADPYPKQSHTGKNSTAPSMQEVPPSGWLSSLGNGADWGHSVGLCKWQVDTQHSCSQAGLGERTSTLLRPRITSIPTTMAALLTRLLAMTAVNGERGWLVSPEQAVLSS